MNSNLSFPGFEALFVAPVLEQWGLSTAWSIAAERVLLISIVLAVAVVANLLLRTIITRVFHRVFMKTRITWDNRLVERGTLLRLSRIAPALLFYASAPLVAPELPWLVEAIQRISAVWIIMVAASTVNSVVDVLHDEYQQTEAAAKRSIKSFIQLAKVVIFLVAGILALTTVLDQSPLGILSGFGALSAVLMLVFRDSILGFVSGVQLAANNMVQIGDWIEMPKYDADGDVVDITLQTIKVQNWDKTFTTIPVYALVSDSFRNWRGMSESGGRRIKRSINIDMHSVRFVDDDLFQTMYRYRRIRPYLEQRKAEIDAYNREHEIDLEDTVSGRRMTNLGVFRRYVTEYLTEHPQIKKDMTFLVRQLQPGPTGIPIEIFVFSADQRWSFYEGIQADIFDHLLAVIPEFDLRVYQEPSGYGINAIAQAIQSGTHSGKSGEPGQAGT